MAHGVSSWFLSDSGEYTSGVRSLLIPAEGAVRTTKTASLASNNGSFPKKHAGKGEKVGQTATERSTNLQSETVTRLRTLAHDLSNSIETVMQASYLLAQAKLEDSNKKWLDLIDKAVQDAARINREIRDILRSQG